MKNLKLFFKPIIRLFIKELNLYNDISNMKKYYILCEKYKKNSFIANFFKIILIYKHHKIFINYSCDISEESNVGKVIFRHPIGIVIGGGAIIEDDVIIHQNVTFGALKFDKKESRGIPCNQIVKKGTIICTGAKILGDVVIGENCIVGANAVVTKDVPDGATVVGYNRIILKESKNG